MSETKQEEKVVDGKTITTTEHESGRKDVHIEVQSLDVDLSDPSNAAAKKKIEEEILPAVANKEILVTVIHKPSNDSVSFICKRMNVRRYAEQVAQKRGGTSNDYCVVQNDDGAVTVTTL